MAGEILRVEGLTKTFRTGGFLRRGGGAGTRAADGVSFSLGGGGDVLVLAGGSGSGKTTVARMILGAVAPDSGKVVFDGSEAIPGGGKEGLRRVRSQCQMIHQDPYDSINPRMRVAQIVAEPLEIHRAGGGDAGARRSRMLEALREARLEPAEAIASMHPHMLSGGQRQRVVLARALAVRPRVIIADEPVSMLDVSIRAEMLGLMSELRESLSVSFLYITHDLATARHFGKRIAVMYGGRIVETGPVADVLLRPRHPYTQALTDAIPEPDPDNLHGRRTVRILEPGAAGGPGAATAAGACRFMERCPYAVDKCAAEPDLRDVGGDRAAACHVELGG